MADYSHSFPIVFLSFPISSPLKHYCFTTTIITKEAENHCISFIMAIINTLIIINFRLNTCLIVKGAAIIVIEVKIIISFKEGEEDSYRY